jgi:hypothetical protein
MSAKLSYEDIKLFKYDAITFYIQESKARLSEEDKQSLCSVQYKPGIAKNVEHFWISSFCQKSCIKLKASSQWYDTTWPKWLTSCMHLFWTTPPFSIFLLTDQLCGKHVPKHFCHPVHICLPLLNFCKLSCALCLATPGRTHCLNLYFIHCWSLLKLLGFGNWFYFQNVIVLIT